MMNQTIFILGANDPEMCEIERILTWDKQKYQYAIKDGKRVHPGNAYQADPIMSAEGYILVLVECEPIATDAIECIRIDHHRPHDPGYGLPPAQFWQASSLGQVINFIGRQAELGSHDQIILAAMDHAPAAAIRGECPGVTAEEVIERKIAEIASATKKSPEEVRDRIGYYASRLEDVPALFIGNEVLSDLRSEYLGEGYSLNLLAAQVAALAGGYTVLLRHRDAAGKPEKWSISGHASPEMIEVFMRSWAPSKGLEGIYGVPSRGYAGGYLPQELVK